MPQVSLLSIETPQVIDTKSVNKNSTDASAEGKSVFSDLIEQHYDSGKDGKEAKNNGNKGLKSSEATNHIEKDPQLVSNSIESDPDAISEIDTNISDVETIEKIETIDPIEKNIDSDVTEQLLSFLTDSEKILSISKDIRYVENTPNNDQSEIKIKEQIINAQVLISAEFGKNDSKQQYNESSEMYGESVSELTGVKVNGVKIDETKSDIVVAGKDNNVEIIVNNDEMLDGLSNAKNNIQASTSEATVDPSITNNKTAKTINSTSQVDLTSLNNVVSREVIASAEITDLEQAAKVLENDKNSLNSLHATQQISSSILSREDELNTKSIVEPSEDKKSAVLSSNSASLNLEQSAVEMQKSVVSSTTNDSVIPSTVNSNVDKASQIIDNAQGVTRSVNQSTASFMEQNSGASDQHEHAGNQQPNQNADVGLLVEEENNEDVLVKDKQNTITPLIKSAINPMMDSQRQSDISQYNENTRAEQSYESVMNNISSDIVQTQKSAVMLQNETISIYQKDFANAVKEKVMIMMNQKLQNIEIQLDPAELGSVNVRVKLQHEQAVISFMVQNQQTKEALEQNMDKLKHMLNESGIDVSDANIEQQGKQSTNNEEDNQQEQSNHQGLFTGDEQEHMIDVNPLKLVKASSTGVDYYA